MKGFFSGRHWRSVISIVLVVCTLFSLCSCSSEKTTYSSKIPDGYSSEDYNEELKVYIVQESEDIVRYCDEEGNEFKYNSATGESYYVHDSVDNLIELCDVSSDGVVHWKIDTDQIQEEGYINTSGSAEAQAATMVIGGVIVTLTPYLQALLATATTIVIGGVTCYAGEQAGRAISNNRKTAIYYPAFQMFDNVYVALSKGLSFDTAVKYIKYGQSVWAKSKTAAKRACVKASPIGAAEWGNHGTRANGYFPHYHAVKYYKSRTKYVHTGAHCWYFG